MSDINKEERAHQMAQRRLLKANNVQRRRFEKMADELVHRAERAQRELHNDELEILRQSVVRNAMGDDYLLLMQLRRKIQKLKDQIEAAQAEAEPIKERLAAKGIYGGGSYRNGYEYYLDPDSTATEQAEKRDTCRRVVGDETINLKIRECRGSEAYATFEQRKLAIVTDDRMLRDAGEDLRASIWQLVTTDEIRQALDNFRQEWIDETA
jgi:hypothetical protein